MSRKAFAHLWFMPIASLPKVGCTAHSDWSLVDYYNVLHMRLPLKNIQELVQNVQHRQFRVVYCTFLGLYCTFSLWGTSGTDMEVFYGKSHGWNMQATTQIIWMDDQLKKPHLLIYPVIISTITCVDWSFKPDYYIFIRYSDRNLPWKGWKQI